MERPRGCLEDSRKRKNKLSRSGLLDRQTDSSAPFLPSPSPLFSPRMRGKAHGLPHGDTAPVPASTSDSKQPPLLPLPSFLPPSPGLENNTSGFALNLEHFKREKKTWPAPPTPQKHNSMKHPWLRGNKSSTSNPHPRGQRRKTGSRGPRAVLLSLPLVPGRLPIGRPLSTPKCLSPGPKEQLLGVFSSRCPL